MDYNKKISILNRIINGILFKRIGNKLYKLISPTKEHKALAELLYQETYHEHKFSDLITKDQLSKVLASKKIWTEQEEKRLKDLEKLLEQLKVDLYNALYNLNDQKRIRKQIKTIEKSIENAISRKHSLDSMTIENFAENARDQFLFALCILDSYGNSIFDIYNYSKADSEIINVFTSYILNDILTSEEYREIARTEPFRSMWSIGKENCFGLSACDLSIEQKNLILYSKMYDNVYEHPERPTDAVIEDDDMLDGWFTIQRRKVEADRKKEELDKVKGFKDVKQKHGSAGRTESFVMVETSRDAKTIQEANDLNAQIKIKQRQDAIAKADKPLEDHELPDVKMELRQEAMRQMAEKIKRG